LIADAAFVVTIASRKAMAISCNSKQIVARRSIHAALRVCSQYIFATHSPIHSWWRLTRFNGTFRSECLNTHWFLDLKEARQLIEAWRREYNESRPHASLDDRTPSEFASQYAASRVLAET
jgi:hypothetical protein